MFLPWQVADVDGDGWMDIATSFDNTAAAHNKTIYYGKRSAEGSVRYENASWPDTVGRRFGPPAQDAWQISSLGGISGEERFVLAPQHAEISLAPPALRVSRFDASSPKIILHVACRWRVQRGLCSVLKFLVKYL